MPDRATFALRVNERFFYGWVMLAIGFLALLCTGPGQSYTIGLFFEPLLRELDVSSTTLSLVYGVGTGIAALGLSYTGRLVDRHGPRRMLAVITLLLGGVCVLFPFVAHIATLFLAFTAVRFFGQGSLTLAATNLVSQWFSRRRGFALSITSLGFALGLAAYPPIVQRLIATVGWRESWVWMGLAVWVLLVPAALLLVVNRPDDLGLLPDGDTPGQADQAGATQAARDLEESWTPQEALRTATFWVVAIAQAIPSSLITGMYIFHVSYFREQGLSAQLAADVFSITSVSMVVSMLVFGQLLDRGSTRVIVGAGIMLNGVALGALYMVHDATSAVVYAIVLGASSGSMMTNLNYVWPRYFGRKHLGGIQGPAYTITIIGASTGAIPFGLAFDLFGSYREAVGLLAVLPLIFGLAVALMKPPVRPPRPSTGG